MTFCNGSDPAVMAALSCTIPVATLFASPFNLAWGSSVYATVFATNIVNPSSTSNVGNGAIIVTNPDAPLNLVNVPAITSATTIGLSWNVGAANGGSPVLDYRVNWDQGTSVYVVLSTGVTSTSYSTTNALVPNTNYKFKIESRNVFGFSSSYSNEVVILAAMIPNAPSNLANNVAVTSSGVVGLTWSAGISNGGSPIIDYTISYKTGSGSYTTLATGITSTYFTASTLTPDTVYSFLVIARNIVGFSSNSSVVTIRAAAKPSTPAIPSTSVISNTNVMITWTAPNNNGSPITSYTINIRYND